MSQLNPKSKPTLTMSYEGNLQKQKSLEQQIYEIVSMTLLGKDNFYESSNDQITKLQKIVKKLVEKDKIDFIANLAVHVRTNLNIRSIPIVLVITLAKELRLQNKTHQYLRKTIYNIIQRVDEISDVYAYALQVFENKKVVPIAIKNGVADSFSKFDEYQFGKYKGNNKQLSIKDVLRIVHPKSKTKEQGLILEKIVKNTLATPYTWETELSKNEYPKKDIWENLIESKKLGYMACIRNLRNMLNVRISNEHLTMVCDYISNPTAIANSKQFPYRFLSADKSIKSFCNTKVNRAICKAADLSVKNVPDLGDNIWIIIDCSLSMTSVNRNEVITNFNKACLFAAALAKKNANSNNIKITMFSNDAKHISYNPDSPIFDIIDVMSKEAYGAGTNLNAVLELKNSLGFNPKTIVLFSDMQVTRLRDDNKEFLNDPNIIKLAINLAPHSNTPVHENNNWMQVSGYSDSIFNYIQIKNSSTNVINKLSKQFLDIESIKNL